MTGLSRTYSTGRIYDKIQLKKTLVHCIIIVGKSNLTTIISMFSDISGVLSMIRVRNPPK